MINGRRRPLHAIRAPQAEHPGLWLDKYIGPLLGPDESLPRPVKGATEPRTAQQTLVDEVANRVRMPAAYPAFYQRWAAALRDQGARVAEAVVRGRLIVGLGAESVLETAVTLHRTYGMPYIPGSALKGLAAAYARQRLGAGWAADGAAYRTLFGTTAEAGYLTFFDALYVPGSTLDDRPLHPDVITVHHPRYYASAAPQVAPADWDSPNPVPFLSATGRYLVALAAPAAADWLAPAFQILRLALQEYGVGAKTSSGYGRMDLAGETS